MQENQIVRHLLEQARNNHTTLKFRVLSHKFVAEKVLSTVLRRVDIFVKIVL